MRLLFVLLLIGTQALAQAPKSSGKSNPELLDFDADVIEGEREAPALFVQMDIQTPKMDTLIFQRNNFNDFHVVEKNRKPWYRIKTK